jgi:hypothetical protein
VTRLRELADYLHAGQMPPLAWALDAAPDGRDPVAVTWADPGACLWTRYLVLVGLGRQADADLLDRVMVACRLRTPPGVVRHPLDCAGCTDVALALVPTLTLADVEAALARRTA